MKSYKQVSDIFELVRLSHQQMKEFYNGLHKEDETERVKMLLDYLYKHEKHREETLAQYAEDAQDRIMNTWFKYVPESTASDCLNNITIKSDMTIDDVIGIALKLNDCLIKMYKDIIEETVIKEVKEVFTSLLKRLEKEEKNMVRDSEWLYDA